MSALNKNVPASLITYITAFTMFGMDQWTKQMVINTMPIAVDVTNKTMSQFQSYEFLSWLWFTHVVNFGAAFSTFYGKRYLLLTFVGAVIIAMLVYERKSSNTRPKILSISLGLLLAGAAGNFFDRIRLGYVTDFLDLRYNGQNIFAIFNVADISVNIGTGLLIIYAIFIDTKFIKKEDKKSKI